MKYSFVIRKVEQNYVAYVPDLPGCVASGKTADEARRAMKETVMMHLRGLAADNLPLPQPVVGKDYPDGLINQKTSNSKPAKPKPAKPDKLIQPSKPSKFRKLLHF
jgi:Uncharacterized conserved protein